MAGRPKKEESFSARLTLRVSQETKRRYFNCRARYHQTRNGEFLQRLLDIYDDISVEAIQQASRPSDHDDGPHGEQETTNFDDTSVQGIPDTERIEDTCDGNVENVEYDSDKKNR